MSIALSPIVSRIIFLIFLIFTTSLTSCVRFPVTQDECQKLLFSAYHGEPHQTKMYLANCLNYDLPVTLQLCQKANEEFQRNQDREKVKKLWGEKVLPCLTPRS